MASNSKTGGDSLPNTNPTIIDLTGIDEEDDIGGVEAVYDKTVATANWIVAHGGNASDHLGRDIIDLTAPDDNQRINAPASPGIKLNIDTTGVMLNAEEKAEVERMKAWWESKQMQRRKGPFRFLDLPPELRLRVYGYALLPDTPAQEYNIVDFKLPTLTRGSKQLRTEALPAFFSENAFSVVVRSNLSDRKAHRTQTPINTQHNFLSGTTRMRRALRKIVNEAGPAAVIRDITFKVFSTSLGRNTYDHCCVAFIRVKHVHGKLQVTTEDRPMHPRARAAEGRPELGFLEFEAQDVDAAVKAATGRVEDIAMLPSCNGLTLQNIDDIARELRFVAPT